MIANGGNGDADYSAIALSRQALQGTGYAASSPINQYASTIRHPNLQALEQHLNVGTAGPAAGAGSMQVRAGQDKGQSHSPASSPSSAASPMPTTAASLMREGPRDFTVIRDVGDGSFGTVCLADWKSPLPSGTMLSPMQHPTTRPEYVGKRLVAIKKMKKPFASWDECMKLKELKVREAGANQFGLYDVLGKLIGCLS